MESLSLNIEGNDERGVTACLVSLVHLSMRLDEHALAARLFGKVEQLSEKLSILLLPLDQIKRDEIRSRLPAMLDATSFTAAFTEGWEMSDERVMQVVKETFVDGWEKIR